MYRREALAALRCTNAIMLLLLHVSCLSYLHLDVDIVMHNGYFLDTVSA